MARLKITPSQMKVNPGRQENLTSLGISTQLFTKLGAEIGQSGDCWYVISLTPLVVTVSFKIVKSAA